MVKRIVGMFRQVVLMTQSTVAGRDRVQSNSGKIFLIILAAVVFGGFVVHAARETAETYERMALSPYVEHDLPSGESAGREGEVAERTESGDPYDGASPGVILPVSREERLAGIQSPAKQQGAEQNAREKRTCQDVPIDTGYSDLCAQWASVGASRYGNRIAAETYRVSSFAALISALALFVTALAVIIAALAARDASRAVKLMKEGMMPVLTVRPTGALASGGMKLVNAGTGVATGIAVKVGSKNVSLRRRVLKAGEELTVANAGLAPGSAPVAVLISCHDASGEPFKWTERFRVDNDAWVQDV